MTVKVRTIFGLFAQRIPIIFFSYSLFLIQCCYIQKWTMCFNFGNNWLRVSLKKNPAFGQNLGKIIILWNYRINRNGTCYTSTECEENGGSASGNCASGFGVCCLFTIGSSSGSGTTVSINNTYIQNPSFPAVYSETSSLTYTINKCADSK